MTNPVYRDISIQFTYWNDAVQVGVTSGGWISFMQDGSYVLNLHFEGALREDLEAAAMALSKLLPEPVKDPVSIRWR